MKRIASFLVLLNATDMVVISFCILLSIVNIVFYSRVEYWYLNIFLNAVIVLLLLFISHNIKKGKGPIWKQLHYWYLVPLIFIFFKELYLMVDPIRGVIYDDLLISIDRFILGTDPTVELYKISNPLLTEILQIVYATFFFLPVILGIEFILRNKIKELDYSAFIIVYGFILSFIGYLLVPAIGPRFTLHDFATNNLEMPGLFLTDFLREIVNSGESIPSGTLNPAQVVQRDVFPSGHTQMTLLVIILSFKFNSRIKYFFLINGTLLIFATVYLRYHYVIDLIGGVLFMFFTLWSGKIIYNRWELTTTVMKKLNINKNDFEKSSG